MARLPDACSACTCAVTASNTFLPGSARSAAKLRPARVPTSIAGPCPSGTANGVSRATCACLSRSLPFGRAEIEPVGRQRPVDRAGVLLRQRLLARLEIVGDLAETLARRILRQRLDARPGEPGR